MRTKRSVTSADLAFSERFRTTVARLGMSVSQADAQIDVARSTLYRLYRGEQPPTLGQIWAIARGLGVPPTELLPLDPSEVPEHPNPEPAITAEQRELLDAVENGDPSYVRPALAKLLHPGAYKAIIHGPSFNLTDKDRQFFKAMADVGDELKRLARLASDRSDTLDPDAGPDDGAAQ